VIYKHAVLDISGKIIAGPFDFSWWSFEEGFLAVQNGEMWGFIDRQGKVVIPFRYRNVWDFSEGLAAAEVNDGKWGFIDQSGTFVIAPQYDLTEGSFFHRRLAPVRIGNKVGYIDKSGAIVIQPQFESASSFYDDFADVKVGEKYGFIDGSGEFVIQPQFDVSLGFHGKLGTVFVGKTWFDAKGRPSDRESEEYWGYVDRSGHWVWGPSRIQ